MKSCICLILSFLVGFSLFSNETEEAKLVDHLIRLDFDNAMDLALKLDKGAELPYFSSICYFMQHSGQKPLIDKLKLENLSRVKEPKDEFLYTFTISIYHLYNTPANEEAFTLIRNSLARVKDYNSKSFEKLVYITILQFYLHEMVQSSDDYYDYLQEYKELAATDAEKAWYHINRIRYYSKSTKPNSTQTYLEKFGEFETFFSNDYLQIPDKITCYYYYYLGLYYRLLKNDNGAAESYSKVVECSKNDAFFHYLHFTSYIYLCEIASAKKEFDGAKKYLSKAGKFWNKSDTIKSRFVQNRFSALYYYEPLQQFDSALYYLKNSIADEMQLDFRNNTLKISESNVKLKTAEKEKQILIEQQQNKAQKT